MAFEISESGPWRTKTKEETGDEVWKVGLGAQNLRAVSVPNSGGKSCSNSSTPPGLWPEQYLSTSSTPPGVWSDSSLCSVVESSGCSTETESNEDDDFTAGLAEQMAHSMLDDDDDLSNVDHSQASITVELERNKSSWATNCWGSQAMNLSSPASAAVGPYDQWDLMQGGYGEGLRFGAEEAAMATSEGIYDAGHLIRAAARNNPPPSNFPWKQPPFQGSGQYYTSSSLQSDFNRFQNAKSQAANAQRNWKQKEDERKIASQVRSSKNVPAVGGGRQIRYAQHQSRQYYGPVGSGMRAVFLGGGANGRESSGTGVFLPRCAGGGSDYKRKPACSTVLLPSRIVPFLNLNSNDMRCQPSVVPSVPHQAHQVPLQTRYPSPEDSPWKTYTVGSAESRLPTEWSY